MKKFISLILTLALTLIISVPAFASERITSKDSQFAMYDLRELRPGETVTIPICAKKNNELAATNAAGDFNTVAALNVGVSGNVIKYVVTVYLPNIGYSYHGDFHVTDINGISCGNYARDTFIGEIPIPWGHGQVIVSSDLNCSAGRFTNTSGFYF